MSYSDHPAQIAALQGLRLRFPTNGGLTWFVADGEPVAHFHAPGGKLTVMPDGEIIGDLEAAGQVRFIEIAAPRPGEYADSWCQWARDVRRAA